jgi:proline iminopeptidase
MFRNVLFACVLAALTASSQPQTAAREGYVEVPGGRVWYRVAGSGKGTPLILLHGGPGGASRALHTLEVLGDERPVIRYDQLGCGRSDRPKDTGLWRVERFVEELKTLRNALGLKQVHILGHSWGSMLAMDYMLTHPQGVRSLILAGPAISIPRYLEDVQKLRAALPKETQEVLARHEAAGTTDSKEYQDATMVFYQRHLCRVKPWPEEMSSEGFGTEVYNFMWGPSEFYATGTLKDYDRTSRLGELRLPVLFTAGRYDETTPEQAEWYRSLVPGARIVIMENSAHMTMLDEPDRYAEVIRTFLHDVERGK